MSKVCAKHRANPVTIYRQCVSCEIDGQRAEIERIEADRSALAQRCAELEADLTEQADLLKEAIEQRDSLDRLQSDECFRREKTEVERDALRAEVERLRAEQPDPVAVPREVLRVLTDTAITEWHDPSEHEAAQDRNECLCCGVEDGHNADCAVAIALRLLSGGKA